MVTELVVEFSGVVPALAVPFKDHEVDFELLSKHLDRLLKSGVDGLFVVATTGLGHAMGIKSKLELVRFVAENRKTAFMIVNTASIEFEEVKELVKESERVGADAIASNVMYYFKVDDEGALKFFTKVASLTELPFFIYNIPQTTGYNIHPRLIRILKRELKNLVGVKDSSANILQIADLATIDGLKVFSGADEISLPALIAGASGYVSALSNVVPELFVGMYRAYREGDISRAAEFYRKILEISTGVKDLQLNVSIYGALSVLYGKEFPLMGIFRPLSRSEKEIVEKTLRNYLEKLGAVTKG